MSHTMHARKASALRSMPSDDAEWIDIVASESELAFPVFSREQASSLSAVEEMPVFAPPAGFTSLR